MFKIHVSDFHYRIRSSFCVHIKSIVLFYVVPHPTVSISRSRDGPVYAGTTFELRVDISSNNLRVDIAIDISWKQRNNMGNTVIASDTRTTVSAVSGSGDSYTASLTYSPITISDSGQITANISISVGPYESMCVETIATATETLFVEGILPEKYY